MSELPEGEPFTGDAAEMKDSPWIGADDLDLVGGTAVVTITDVVKPKNPIQFEGGRREKKYFVTFGESKKALILNSTNREFLVSLFTRKTVTWRGKKVELYIDPHVRDPNNPGQFTRGVRIREHKGGVK